MIWSMLLLGGLAAVGAAMMWLEWRRLDSNRWLTEPVCIRCGRDSEDAWCTDCADYLGLTR